MPRLPAISSGDIAGSIITVTSIMLSPSLIAVKPGAASLTSLVSDQFLRRRTNQLYFGAFIGLALYSLIALASINPSHQPIYGVAVAGLMTVVALFMPILLITRPSIRYGPWSLSSPSTITGWSHVNASSICCEDLPLVPA